MSTFSYFDPPMTLVHKARAALWDVDMGETEEGYDNDGTQTAFRSDEFIAGEIAAHGYALGVAAVAFSLASEAAQEPTSVGIAGAVNVAFAGRLAHWQSLAAPYAKRLTRAAGPSPVALMGVLATPVRPVFGPDRSDPRYR